MEPVPLLTVPAACGLVNIFRRARQATRAAQRNAAVGVPERDAAEGASSILVCCYGCSVRWLKSSLPSTWYLRYGPRDSYTFSAGVVCVHGLESGQVA